MPLQGNPLVLSVNNYEILVDPHTSLVFSYVFLIFNDTDIKTVIEVNINKIWYKGNELLIDFNLQSVGSSEVSLQWGILSQL